MTLKGVFVILITTVLSGCSSESDSWSPPDSQDKVSIAMPTAKNSQLPQNQGIWRAFVTIPGAGNLICDTPIDADTCELTIDIAAHRATAQIQLATGTYSPQIVWEYQDTTFSNPIRQDGFWPIANAKKQLTIEKGKNTSLTFSVDDYKPLPDDDEDGMSNLAELEDRTDPSDSNEPPRESVCLAQMTQYFTFEEKNIPPYTDLLEGSSANCSNCPTVTQGQIGMSLRFDGTNEIDVPDNGQFDWELGDEFSIEYWMNSTSDCKRDNGEENEVIVGRQGPTHPNPHMWIGCTGGPDVQGQAVFVLMDVDGGRGGDASDDWPRSNSPVTDGEWHHIVAVKTKTHIHLYVDGIKSSVAKTYTAGFASTTPLNIGYLNLGDGFHYNGDLDEVAYYSKALTDEEVMGHFNRGQMLGEGYCDKRRR